MFKETKLQTFTLQTKNYLIHHITALQVSMYGARFVFDANLLSLSNIINQEHFIGLLADVSLKTNFKENSVLKFFLLLHGKNGQYKVNIHCLQQVT